MTLRPAVRPKSRVACHSHSSVQRGSQDQPNQSFGQGDAGFPLARSGEDGTHPESQTCLPGRGPPVAGEEPALQKRMVQLPHGGRWPWGCVWQQVNGCGQRRQRVCFICPGLCALSLYHPRGDHWSAVKKYGDPKPNADLPRWPQPRARHMGRSCHECSMWERRHVAVSQQACPPRLPEDHARRAQCSQSQRSSCAIRAWDALW